MPPPARLVAIVIGRKRRRQMMASENRVEAFANGDTLITNTRRAGDCGLGNA
jgi:hypothetical protein